MSKNTELLTKDEAIALVGGESELIHCFINAGFGLIGADWDWPKFLQALDNAKSIQHSGATAVSMGHPVAVSDGEKWMFFGKGL